MFNKYKARIKELEARIQGMSEIITDFERNVFKVTMDEYCSIITNNSDGSNKGGSSIEIMIGEVTNIIEEDAFAGKKIEFRLKHPRTYR